MGNAGNLDEINKNYLVHFISDQIDTAEQVKHFDKFQFVIKRLVDKGYKFLSVTEDEFYLYFRIERVISLLCYHLIQNKKFYRYYKLFEQYLRLRVIDEKEEIFLIVTSHITFSSIPTYIQETSEIIYFVDSLRGQGFFL